MAGVLWRECICRGGRTDSAPAVYVSFCVSEKGEQFCFEIGKFHQTYAAVFELTVFEE